MASSLPLESLMWETMVDASAYKRELTRIISPSSSLFPPNPLASAFPNFLFCLSCFSFSFYQSKQCGFFCFCFTRLPRLKNAFCGLSRPTQCSLIMSWKAEMWRGRATPILLPSVWIWLSQLPHISEIIHLSLPIQLIHLAWCLQDSSKLKHVSELPTFLRLNNISLCVYTTLCLSIHLFFS